MELAALTTLVGSQTAEYLALGDRGPVGLPWACMSAFGSFSVVRTCITGACPHWLRDTLGVRTSISDASLGVSLDLHQDFRGASRIRRSGMEAIGISCEVVCFLTAVWRYLPLLTLGRNPRTSNFTKIKPVDSFWQDVYVFNRHISSLLVTTPATSSGNPPRVITYDYNYDELWETNTYAGVALMAALIKLSEAYFVWKLGGLVLCCICLSTWLYFFLAATALHFRYMWKMRGAKLKQNVLDDNVVDVLAGELPTTMRLGGEERSFLGPRKAITPPYHGD